MADDGTIFAVVDLGDAPGNDTDRGLVRISDYRGTPTYEIILQGGTSIAGTDVGGGLSVGSNSSKFFGVIEITVVPALSSIVALTLGGCLLACRRRVD